ncbi:unnamed protein product [Rhizophagus irregularis]|nr:unnamed protein product [Rhizophagus irregularis]CAB5303277.1 unnamed protein product [Rhizophagus irregularis]
MSLELTIEAGLLNEGKSAEYLGRGCIYKATLRHYVKVVLYQKWKISFVYRIYTSGENHKFVSYKNEDNLFIDHFSISFLGDDLEKRLRQLYVKENIVDIFWGRSLKDDDTIWSVYVVRNIPYLFKRTENVMEDQMIRLIIEEEGFANTEIRRQGSHDPLPTL